MDPMFLDFSIPERYISEVKPGQKIDFSVDVYDSQKFQAEISAIDPQIDPTTRNFKVQGVVSNGDEKLRPGMFARVTFFIGSEREVVTIPASSINYAPYGNSVFVVEKMTGPNGEYAGAKQQFVTLGSSIGDLVEIVNGLSVGQEVVTSGTFKLQNGTQLIINNSVLPNANARPEVDNT
jgi:membrane fusion protein (multidrug efflux system)